VLDKLMQGFVMFACRNKDWKSNVNGEQTKRKYSSAYSRCAKEYVEELLFSFAWVLH
jgi:hypothetical protein